MRANHIIAVAAVVLIGFTVKVGFLSAPIAQANADGLTIAGLDVSKLHVNAKLPEQAMHDMSFVFSHAK